MKNRLPILIAATAVACGLGSVPASGNDFEPQIIAAFEDQIAPWLSDPSIIEAIRAQNEAHKSLTEAEIGSLDQQWRSEAESGSGPLVDRVLGTDLSGLLVEKKSESGDLITEMFIMDNVGLNVGQSDVTSDYMQGDEAKWQKTYQVGAGAVFVDEVEFDDSTETFQSQVSSTIVDPATGEPIGAITIGINLEALSG